MSEAVYEVIPKVAKGAHVEGMEAYKKIYERSVQDPSGFWAEKARLLVHWYRDFDIPMTGSMETHDVAWFLNGTLNVCTNCVDRHIPERGDQAAIIWEGDEIGENRTVTYKELLAQVSKIGNAMRSYGVKKGDTVTVYMPMVPELAMVMLACARIGAIHSVVFAGFSAEALRERIVEAKSKWVFVTDEGKRGGRTLPLKKTVDAACAGADCVENVFVFRRTGAENVPFDAPRDVWIEDVMVNMRPYCSPEWMDSEDVLFILYTSGSTGRPKGISHTSAGYLLYATMTTKYTFDLRDGDVYACVADCGWITGHTYIVYGPLSNGTTTVMFESTPLYPDHGRYWDLVQKHKVTQFYTAPTAIRALMRFGEDVFEKYDLSSLRVLGTVGEPINPAAWEWYYEHVGKKNCYICDTFWQTETGGHVGTGLPGCTPMKPGSCSMPFFGIQFCLLTNEGTEVSGPGEGMLCIKYPWPGMMRTIHGDHERCLTVYMKPFPGYYFTGDGAKRDADGYIWITGRVDDVLNVSGHRIGTAEVESALVAHDSCAEAATVGFPHEVKGEAICCYVILADGADESKETVAALRSAVRGAIGAFATPDYVIPVSGLPKTRSGKIMRRVLRKIMAGEEDQLGDTSTLADPDVVDILIEAVKAAKAAK